MRRVRQFSSSVLSWQLFSPLQRKLRSTQRPFLQWNRAAEHNRGFPAGHRDRERERERERERKRESERERAKERESESWNEKVRELPLKYFVLLTEGME